MNELKYLLENITSSGYGYSLDTICKTAGIKSSGMTKSKKINALIEFYSAKDCIVNIWNALSSYEKELLTCYVQCGYRQFNSDFAEIAKKYNIPISKYRYGEDPYFTKDSKLNLIRINRSVPSFIKTILNDIIPPLEINFKTVTDIEEYCDKIEGRENRLSDFDYLIRFVNNQAVPATKAGGLMNKKSFLKYYDIVRYPEILLDESDSITDIRDIRSTVISYSIVQLLLNAQVLSIHMDKYILGKYASHYLELDAASKARFIYDAYLKHNNSIIDEISRIEANQFKMNKHYNPSPAIKVLIQYLTKCPVMKWISMDSYKSIIKKKDFYFLSACTSDVYFKDHYYNTYYETAGWGELETYFIDVVFMCYLSAIGVLDIVTDKESDDYGVHDYHIVTYFRLTELGAFLLGLTDNFKIESNSNDVVQKGLIVKPDFEIVIPDGPKRTSHEVFFERFLIKKTEDAQVSIYNLDFNGIVKAIDIGISLDDIYSYLTKHSLTPVPDNITTTFHEWIQQSKRIKIKTVTIIETDDEFLLEEIKNYKTMNTFIKSEIKHALTIDPADIKKVKKLIEKNKRFAINSLN